MESGKQTCAGCHFLMDTGTGCKFEVTQEQRDKLLRNDWSWVVEQGSLACYRGVWDERNGSDKDKRSETIVRTDRQSCQLF